MPSEQTNAMDMSKHTYTTSSQTHLSNQSTPHPAAATAGFVTPDSTTMHLLTPAQTHNGTRPNKAGGLLHRNQPLRLAAFNVRTLRQCGQQAALHRTLESLDIDICCLSETRIQDPSVLYRLRSPTGSSGTAYHLRLSEDCAASAAGQAGVGIALSDRAEAAVLEWIPVNSRLCAVRLEGSLKVSSKRDAKRCLFVVAAYAPTDCSPDLAKNDFYCHLQALLHQAPRSDIVILAGDLNARVGRLCTVESRLGGPHGLDACRNDNGERLLQLCADNRLYLSSLSFRHKKRHLATWRSPNSGHAWTQIDHIAISYRWRGCVQDCRSLWSTCLDSDHALVCSKLALRFCGRRKPRANRLDVSKLSRMNVLDSFQRELANRLPAVMHTKVEEWWTSLQNALYTSAEATCGTIVRSSDPWISEQSLHLIDSRRSIPADTAYDAARTAIRRDLKRSLREDRENWWNKKAAEMEAAYAAGNSRKLFQLIRRTGIWGIWV